MNSMIESLGKMDKQIDKDDKNFTDDCFDQKERDKLYRKYDTGTQCRAVNNNPGLTLGNTGINSKISTQAHFSQSSEAFQKANGHLGNCYTTNKFRSSKDGISEEIFPQVLFEKESEKAKSGGYESASYEKSRYRARPEYMETCKSTNSQKLVIK